MRAERSPERLHFTECSYNVTAVMTSYCTETNIQEIVLYVIYDTWTWTFREYQAGMEIIKFACMLVMLGLIILCGWVAVIWLVCLTVKEVGRQKLASVRRTELASKDGGIALVLAEELHDRRVWPSDLTEPL